MARIESTNTLLKVIGLCVLAALARPAAAALQGPPDAGFHSVLSQAVAQDDGFKDIFDAQVWLQDMSRRLADKLPDPRIRLRLLEIVHREASRLNIPPELVLAVIDVESDFHRFAISDAGARGYMQVMPFWLRRVGRPDVSLFNPQINIRIGCLVLRHYLDEEQGDMLRALARYNGSTGSTQYSDRVLKALTLRWFRQ